MQDIFLSLVMPLFGVLLILFLAYFGTRYLSRHYMKMSSGRTIQVLERAVLGQDKFLALVKAGSKVYLLGVTDKSITTVCEWEGEDLPIGGPKEPGDFSSVFAESLRKWPFLEKLSKKEKNGEGHE